MAPVKEAQSVYQKLKDFDETLDIFSDKGFEDLELNPLMVKNFMEYMQLEKPTKVQQLSIQVLMKNRDAMIKAQTGSGKTLAYLAPVVHDIVKEYDNISRTMGTYALIISPTRELSQQIYEVLRKTLRPFPHIVPGIIMGGEKKKSEKARLRKGVTILIATPGRLVDHLRNTASFEYKKCKWLVLDEADRLLDLGFENDIRFIIDTLNQSKVFSTRRSVLASATLNKNVDKLALLSLNKPVFVSLDQDPGHQGSEEAIQLDENFSHQIPSTLTQHVTVVEPKRKLLTFISFLRWKIKTEKTKIIVFFASCDSVEYYHSMFSMVELPVSMDKETRDQRERLIMAPLFKLHGNLSQEDRRSTFKAFCKSSTGVLFCTDVAARGLDIPDIHWIIQYDVPSDPKAYIHRIGRTARIGSKGDALLLLFPSEEEYLQILEKWGMQFNKLSYYDILRHLKTNLEPNPKKDPLLEAGSLQHRLLTLVESGGKMNLKSLGVKAFQSFIRSYATHTKATKHIFHIKNLHLGHLCKNFVLKDTPSSLMKFMVASGLNAERKKKKKEEEEKGRVSTTRKQARHLTKTIFTSEFASGV